MKKTILLIILSVLSLQYLRAQSPCYNAAFQDGKGLYDQGKYSKAKASFSEAKKCPDPDVNEADEWIRKCNEKIKEQEARNKENEAAKSAYMHIHQVDYCNVENGQMIDNYGATLYQSKLKELQPRITYDAILNETKNAVIFIKVYNPSGILVTGKNSPSGYTYSANVRVLPGNGKTLLISTWNNNGLPYSVGKYKYEIWCKDNQLFSSSFVVSKDEPVEVAVPVNPVEKKAEILVVDNNGTPLEGAKLLEVGTNKYELTNSEGVGRIDLSDRNSKMIEVSHKLYDNKKSVRVYVGDYEKVVLNKSQKKENVGLKVAQYAVPGFYQLKSDMIFEGVAFIGGESLLLVSGLVSNAAAKKQLKVMQNSNVSLSDFQSARRKYNAHRAVNIISYTSAVLVYGAHLYRTYTLSRKYGNLSMSPAIMGVGDEMAVGLNINITF